MQDFIKKGKHFFQGNHIWVLLSVLAFAVAIALYAYLGIFSRPQSDDYCFGSVIHRIGLWRAQPRLYQTTTNRYTTSFFLTLLELAGIQAGRLLSTVILLLWITGLTWLAWRILRVVQIKANLLVSLLLAESIVFLIVLEAPNLHQVLYWRSATVAYSLSLAGLICLMAVMVARLLGPGKPRWYGCALAAMAFFILGGFSETTLALQIGMLGIGFAGFWFWRGRKGQVHWELLLSALAGSLISLVVVFLSPANALRQASFLSPPTIVELISMSFYNAFAFLHDSFQANGFRSLIGFLIPMLLFYCIYARDARPRKISPASLTVWLMIAPLIVYLLMVCVCAPSAYGSSSYPEDRVLIYGTFLLNALIVLEGALVGIILGQLHHYARQPVPPFMRWAALVLFFLLSLYPIYNLPKTLAEVPGYRDWAEAWDARDAQIRTQAAQGITDVEVTAFDSIYLVLELGPDPNEWVNGCAAHYYGVNSITAHLP